MSSVPVEPADPRPVLVECRVRGSRCRSCGRPDAWVRERCAACLGPCEPETFGPSGIVWSSTDVHLPIGHRLPPFTLAQVDLHDGPRILARLEPTGELAPGTPVQIVGSDDGDVVVGP